MAYVFDNTSVTDISKYFVKVSQTEGKVTLVIFDEDISKTYITNVSA